MADTDTIDTMLAALYDGFSHGAGPNDMPDWNRIFVLFHPQGRIIPPPVPGEPVFAYTIQEFVRLLNEPDGMGLYEVETARVTATYQNIAQVWSTYETYSDKTKTTLLEKGINSWQFLFAQNRWWVMNVFWDNEVPGP